MWSQVSSHGILHGYAFILGHTWVGSDTWCSWSKRNGKLCGLYEHWWYWGVGILQKDWFPYSNRSGDIHAQKARMFNIFYSIMRIATLLLSLTLRQVLGWKIIILWYLSLKVYLLWLYNVLTFLFSAKFSRCFTREYKLIMWFSFCKETHYLAKTWIT